MRSKLQLGSPLRFTVLVAVLLLSACASSEGLAVGDEAPGFSLPEAYGATVSLDDFAGTATLLYFHMADG